MKEILDKNGLTEAEFLKEYDDKEYEKPSVTNDILIFTVDDKEEKNSRKVPKKGMQVLLIKRKEHPFIEKWAVPGGFVRMNESLKEGAVRELVEETGVKDIYVEQLYTYGDLQRDPRTRVISVANMALVPKKTIRPKAGDDAKEVAWFWVEKKYLKSETTELYIEKHYILSLVSEDENVKMCYEVKEKMTKDICKSTEVSYKLLSCSNDSLAFDHYKMISYGVDRIRNKIQYTPIAVNLLPRLFTVKELQLVYEAILGREVLNFRRKIGEMIIETDELIEGKPYRPAQVFKYNEDYINEF